MSSVPTQSITRDTTSLPKDTPSLFNSLQLAQNLDYFPINEVTAFVSQHKSNVKDTELSAAKDTLPFQTIQRLLLQQNITDPIKAEEFLSSLISSTLEQTGQLLTHVSYLLGYIKAHRLWAGSDASFEAYLQRKGYKYILRDMIHGLEEMQHASPRAVS